MQRSSVSILLGASLLFAASARAQTADDDWAPPPTGGPSTGEASFLSGRTLTAGETLIAASLGWPGFAAYLELAPDSRVNIGASILVGYGAPVMGLDVGASGEAAMPMRFHLFGENRFDLALRVAPHFTMGEGRVMGEAAAPDRANELGLSGRVDVGMRMGWNVVDRVTILAGFDVGAGIANTLRTTERVRAIGILDAVLGIEALMSRDTLLFAEISAGAGIADDSQRDVPYFPRREVIGLALGLGYLL